ncbi:hypothetical protein C8J57DRAFT_1670904 [Mycena rebaudengoi]|nr:hypothetical protein C8J57DRAFT_1670904 [Mycena rebaudengoi]
MKLAVLAAALVSGAAAQLMINTPYAPQLLPALSTQLHIRSTNGPTAGAPECQPVLISWTGGEGPFFVSVQNSPPTGIPVVDFGKLDASPITWPALNQTLGTLLILQVKDNTGTTSSSAPFPVTAGSDSCLSGGGGGGGGVPPPPQSGSGGGSPSSTPGSGGGSPTKSGTPDHLWEAWGNQQRRLCSNSWRLGRSFRPCCPPRLPLSYSNAHDRLHAHKTLWRIRDLFGMCMIDKHTSESESFAVSLGMTVSGWALLGGDLSRTPIHLQPRMDAGYMVQ